MRKITILGTAILIIGFHFAQSQPNLSMSVAISNSQIHNENAIGLNINLKKQYFNWLHTGFSFSYNSRTTNEDFNRSIISPEIDIIDFGFLINYILYKTIFLNPDYS